MGVCVRECVCVGGSCGVHMGVCAWVCKLDEEDAKFKCFFMQKMALVT